MCYLDFHHKALTLHSKAEALSCSRIPKANARPPLGHACCQHFEHMQKKELQYLCAEKHFKGKSSPNLNTYIPQLENTRGKFCQLHRNNYGSIYEIFCTLRFFTRYCCTLSNHIFFFNVWLYRPENSQFSLSSSILLMAQNSSTTRNTDLSMNMKWLHLRILIAAELLQMWTWKWSSCRKKEETLKPRVCIQ